MGAIGGLVDFVNREVEFSAFNRMRLAMSLRGRKRSTACFGNEAGLFFNSPYDDEIFQSRDYEQPYISDLGGKITALCVDSESILPSALGEKYFTYGIDFLGCLDGGFALALYDEERGILVLARDKKGRKPLYYRNYKGTIYFSSEVKGILAAIDENAEVDRAAVKNHLLAPAGLYRAVNIYPRIKEVFAGECIVFSRLGESRVFYCEKQIARHIGTKQESLCAKSLKVSCADGFDVCGINGYLSDALIAFDYPEFDAYMPFVMETFMKSVDQGYRSVRFEDAMRRKNLIYAREREDRLSSFYGIIARGYLPKSELGRNAYSNIMYEELREKILSMQKEKQSILKSMLGSSKFETICKLADQKNEDADKNIRILALTCQCAEWLASRKLFLV